MCIEGCRPQAQGAVKSHGILRLPGRATRDKS